AAAATLA
ncbi:hypothetical protein A2U01_0066204, partial [Trifolium medium]|nr:hypothetical protein [Trifolium medium]